MTLKAENSAATVRTSKEYVILMIGLQGMLVYLDDIA